MSCKLFQIFKIHLEILRQEKSTPSLSAFLLISIIFQGRNIELLMVLFILQYYQSDTFLVTFSISPLPDIAQCFAPLKTTPTILFVDEGRERERRERERDCW